MRSDFSPRSLLALVVVLGLIYLVIDLSGRLYYVPICERYAEEEQLIYTSHTVGRPKWGTPAECFFRDRRGNSERVEVSEIPPTSGDTIRWAVSWLTTIGGLGGSVWIASLIAGRKPGRRRDKKRRSKRDVKSIHDT